MSAAAAEVIAGLPTPAAPRGGRAGVRSSHFNLPSLLATLFQLFVHGRKLAFHLRESAAEPGFAWTARLFGSSDLEVIAICIRRGIIRIRALYAMLARREARGLDVPPPPRDSGPKPRGRDAPAEVRPAPSRWWRSGDLSYLPSEAEAADEVRRRSMGAILADICLDFGMCAHNNGMLWWRLLGPIMRCGGGCAHNRLMRTVYRRLGVIGEQSLPEGPPPANGDWPVELLEDERRRQLQEQSQRRLRKRRQKPPEQQAQPQAAMPSHVTPPAHMPPDATAVTSRPRNEYASTCPSPGAERRAATGEAFCTKQAESMPTVDWPVSPTPAREADTKRLP